MFYTVPSDASLFPFQGTDSLNQKIAAVLPTEADEQWRTIPWEPNLMRARLTAQQTGKPLFIWIMDGNVLGCTCNSGQLSRHLVLSHPEVIYRLQTAWIPVSAGTEKLQWGHSEAATWFKHMAAHAIKTHRLDGWWHTYQNYQGIYLASPDGMNYGLLLQWDVDQCIRVLDEALEQYQSHRPQPFTLTHEQIEQAAPTSPDATTSVVRVFSRCRPMPRGAHFLNHGVGRDHMWIFAHEVQQIIGATNESKRSQPMNRSVVARMARFHLLDNVRGMADPFGADEVAMADFRMSVLHECDDIRTIAFTGAFAARKDFPGDDNYAGEIGVAGTIEGAFQVRLATAKIEYFRAYGEAQAWGANANTWHQPDGLFPLVIAMIEAQDERAASVPPMWYDVSEQYYEFLTQADYINPALTIDTISR
jgi:hypothetical protein